MSLSQQRKNMLIGIAVVLAVVGLFFWLLFRWVEWVPEEEELGWSAKANARPYLAASQYLQKQGVAAEYKRSFIAFSRLGDGGDEGVGATDTFVLANAYGVVDEERFEKLLPWLENGGTIVVSTHNTFTDTTEPDALFRHLEITVHDELRPAELRVGETREEAEERVKSGFSVVLDWLEKMGASPEPDDSPADSDEEADNEAENEAEKENSIDADQASPADAGQSVPPMTTKVEDDVEQVANSDRDKKENVKDTDQQQEAEFDPEFCPELQMPTEIEFASEPAPLQAHFNLGRHFDAHEYVEPAGWVANHYGLVFAQYKIGEGNVFVTLSNRIWQNRHIRCLDHAYLLSKLTEGSDKVWFIDNHESPSMTESIWRLSPVAIVSLLGALIAWLIYHSNRFGPVLHRRGGARRSFAEHLRAHGQFAWRRQVHTPMLRNLRKDLFAEFNRRVHGFADYDEPAVLDYFEEHTHYSRTDLYRALFKDLDGDSQELVKAIQCIKKIRETLL